jgi:hypothetical protein
MQFRMKNCWRYSPTKKEVDHLYSNWVLFRPAPHVQYASPLFSLDYATQLSPAYNHNWIGGFCIVGAGAHAAIFMVRDYDPTNNYNNLLDRVIRQRDAMISLKLGMYLLRFPVSFGLYIQWHIKCIRSSSYVLRYCYSITNYFCTMDSKNAFLAKSYSSKCFSKY